MEQQGFKRSYRACIHCRTRKVRCNLGHLEHPSQPPCLRCRREGRSCIFAESRRGGNRRMKGKGEQQSDEYQNDLLAKAQYDKHRDDIIPKSRLSSYDECPSSATTMTAASQETAIREHELHNTHDAMDILVHVARNMPPAESSSDQGGNETRSHDQSSAPVNNLPESCSKRPLKKRKMLTLSDSDPVREGYINEADARVLVDFFWHSLHPFYPFVPHFLRQINQLISYRTLFWTILTISARYYCSSLPSEIPHEGGAFHRGLHDRLWERTNKELGHLCISTGQRYWNVGTVMALLLFTEWNPRAIHYSSSQHPSNDEIEDDDGEEDKGVVTSTGGWNASRTSSRMAWLMVSMAIRMSIELDLFSRYSEIYVGIYVSELDVAVRQGSHCTSATLLPALQLPIDGEQRSLMRLLEIRSLAQQTLYKSRATTRQILKDGSYISFLSLFSNHLASWLENNQSCLEGHSLNREANLLEYHYTRLYIYSLALSPSNFSDAMKAIPFMELATRAAHECVRVVLRVHDMGCFARAPVRWFVRVVHSAVFMVKAHLLTPKMQGGQETIDILKKLVNVLKEASPDEVHLASKYSHILDQICKNIFRQNYLSSGSDYPNDASDYNIKRAAACESTSPIPNLSQISTTRQDEQSPPCLPDQDGSIRKSGTTCWKNEYHNKSCAEPCHSGDGGYLQLTAESSIDSFGDFTFDFLTEGSEGLGFVDRLMADFDQHPTATDNDGSGAMV